LFRKKKEELFFSQRVTGEAERDTQGAKTRTKGTFSLLAPRKRLQRVFPSFRFHSFALLFFPSSSKSPSFHPLSIEQRERERKNEERNEEKNRSTQERGNKPKRKTKRFQKTVRKSLQSTPFVLDFPTPSICFHYPPKTPQEESSPLFFLTQ
jgi:hypothetical protein